MCSETRPNTKPENVSGYFMKYLSSLILFLLSAFVSFGQTNEKINEMNYFINTIIDFFKADRYLLPDSNNIFLSSNAPGYFRDYILTTDTLKDINNKKPSDYFILTNEEKNQILVDTMKWTKLSQKMFQLDNIKLVSKDTVKNRYDPSYLIYKPIFLRDNTVCLFYYDFICSLCGHGTFWLYKKTKKSWEPWIEIGGWTN